LRRQQSHFADIAEQQISFANLAGRFFERPCHRFLN
jgi:hypothetical protein